MDYRPYYKSEKPLKNIWRIAALLLFVSLAVTLVFFAEKEFSEQSLNNMPLTYKTGRSEPEPMIVPEWEIPDLPSSKPEGFKQTEEMKEEEVQERPKPESTGPAEVRKKDEKQAKEETLSKTASLHAAEPAEKTSGNAAPEEKLFDADPQISIEPEAIKKAEADKIYTEADKLPQFGGGSPAFVQYLKKNLQYPADAREKGITGRVLVTFVVERDGKISNVSVVRGIGNGCDEEAVRVMQNAPSWIPGEERGEKVRVQCTIPITFALQ